MSSSGWDWDRIAESDYPVVTNPAVLQRDVVYCEFWTVDAPSGAYGYLTGLVIPWSEWLAVREGAAGEPLHLDLSRYGLDEAALYPYTRARFGIWAAPVNPRFPRQTIAVWSLEGGFWK